MTVEYTDSDELDEAAPYTVEAADDPAEPDAKQVRPVGGSWSDASLTTPGKLREYKREEPKIRTADAEALKREADEYFTRKQYVAARATFEDALRILSHADDASRVASDDANAALWSSITLNLALACLLAGDAAAAVAQSTALLDAPTTTHSARVKGLFRRGLAREALADWAAASADFAAAVDAADEGSAEHACVSRDSASYIRGVGSTCD